MDHLQNHDRVRSQSRRGLRTGRPLWAPTSRPNGRDLYGKYAQLLVEKALHTIASARNESEEDSGDFDR